MQIAIAVLLNILIPLLAFFSLILADVNLVVSLLLLAAVFIPLTSFVVTRATRVDVLSFLRFW